MIRGHCGKKLRGTATLNTMVFENFPYRDPDGLSKNWLRYKCW